MQKRKKKEKGFAAMKINLTFAPLLRKKRTGT